MRMMMHMSMNTMYDHDDDERGNENRYDKCYENDDDVEHEDV